MPSTLMDDAFELLSIASDLEKEHRIEAATKVRQLQSRGAVSPPDNLQYYEAIYLMKRYVQRLPQIESEDQSRRLIESKIEEYRTKAQNLMEDDSSTRDQQRSPSTENSFAPEEREDSSRLHPLDSVPKPGSDDWKTRLNEANTHLSNALDIDERGGLTQAKELYMKCASIYLDIIKVSDGPSTRAIKYRLESVLQRLEQMKGRGAAQKKHIQQTVPTHLSLTPREVEILKQSSLIASGLFLPWSDDDARALLADARSSGPLYVDPAGKLPLSAGQQPLLCKWARPAEVVKMRKSKCKPVMIQSITPYTIVQRFVTDCSFVASLCVCAAYERKFKKQLITSILYPQDRDGRPVYNPAGKYMVKLWLNGVQRCVTIDDFLPVDRFGNLLCSHTNTRSGDLELWVCLIEKAFLKMSGGGYGFPGSNSGIDMFSLTGWIPEAIKLAKDQLHPKDYETPTERAWDRIASAFAYGDCLVTVSSSPDISSEETERLGIVTAHAYAVLAVLKTRSGLRLLQLKNPWAEKGWKGRYSPADVESWTPALQKEVGYDASIARGIDDGIFWICWEDVLKYFKNFHLSWDLLLFQHQTITHDFWPESQGPVDDTHCIGESPQYILSFSEETLKFKPSVWILLSRHVSKSEQLDGKTDDYMAVNIFRNTSSRNKIWYPTKKNPCVLFGAYTNSPQVLVRFEPGPDDKDISVVVSQHEKKRDIIFSLSIFATQQFHFGPPSRSLLVHKRSISGLWTKTSAGQRVGSPGFLNNPSFTIRTNEKVQVQIRLQTEKAIAIQALVVHDATKRTVIDTGKYRYGCVVSDVYSLVAGSYLLIVSSYNEGHSGNFEVVVDSSRAITIDGKS